MEGTEITFSVLNSTVIILMVDISKVTRHESHKHTLFLCMTIFGTVTEKGVRSSGGELVVLRGTGHFKFGIFFLFTKGLQ